MSKKVECPVCKKAVKPLAENRGFPFCSMRCRQVDLGRWLGEEYRVPDRQVEEQEDESSQMSDDESQHQA